MAERFRGEGQQKVDSKGRVSIPARFRRVLEAGDPSWVEGKRPELVIVYGGAEQDFLEVYTMEAIGRLEAKIDRLPSGPLKRKLTKQNIAQALHTEVDPDGRLVIPKAQRDKIGLEGMAYFISTGTTFQIWNLETYKRFEAEEEGALDLDLPDDPNALMDALDAALANLGDS